MAAAGRMRRVDEAVRQVLADAIAEELKDPRVGFVTVTDVSTSPDLTSARVYVSVLGDAPDREASLAGLRSAHGVPAGADRPGAEAAAHADARVRLRRHDRPRDAHRARCCASGAIAHDRRRHSHWTRARRCSRRSARRALPAVVTHEHPDGDALGSLIAMQALLRALGKDSVMVIAPEDFPLPHEYRFLSLDGLVTGPPRGPRRAHRDVPRLRQPRPQPAGGAARRESRSSTSTTTTTTRASAPSTTSSRKHRAPPRSSGICCTRPASS